MRRSTTSLSYSFSTNGLSTLSQDFHILVSRCRSSTWTKILNRRCRKLRLLGIHNNCLFPIQKLHRRTWTRICRTCGPLDGLNNRGRTLSSSEEPKIEGHGSDVLVVIGEKTTYVQPILKDGKKDNLGKIGKTKNNHLRYHRS